MFTSDLSSKIFVRYGPILTFQLGGIHMQTLRTYDFWKSYCEQTDQTSLSRYDSLNGDASY